MIIGVTGYLASGKDTVADYLIGKGLHHYSLSDEIRSILNERRIENNRPNQQKIGNELRKEHGPDYLARRIMKRLVEPAVVTSIRNQGELEFLRSRGLRLIFVDAPIEVRFNRIKARKREGEQTLSFEDFKDHENVEKSENKNCQQLQLMEKLSDYKIINDGTLDDLFEKINKILKETK